MSASAVGAVGLGGAALGALVGTVVRVGLARMRRGATVGPGWCEAGLAVLWGLPVVGVASEAVEPGWLPVALGLGALAVAATATDLQHRRLPDGLTLPAVVLAPIALVPLGPAAVGAGLLGALVFLLAHATVYLAAPAALGAGDVKLAGALGAPLAATSWWALVVVPVLAALVTVLITTAVAATPAARDTAAVESPPEDPCQGIPFGPVMLGATWVVLTVGALAG